MKNFNLIAQSAQVSKKVLTTTTTTTPTRLNYRNESAPIFDTTLDLNTLDMVKQVEINLRNGNQGADAN